MKQVYIARLDGKDASVTAYRVVRIRPDFYVLANPVDDWTGVSSCWVNKRAVDARAAIGSTQQEAVDRLLHHLRVLQETMPVVGRVLRPGTKVRI